MRPPPCLGEGEEDPDLVRSPILLSIDPHKFFTWIPRIPECLTGSGDLRAMLAGGQKEIMSELHTHKAHLSSVSQQVQSLDKKQEDLSKAQGDMATRLNNMEAEVRELKTRSRSVSPAPPPPDQSPRSTTASTFGGKAGCR